MNDLQKRILRAEVKPNCFLLFSASERPKEESFTGCMIEANVSFLYDAGEFAAEWEPEYGPIQIWQKSNEGADNARPHYVYDFVDDRPANYSQLAVIENRLQAAALNGDFGHIFSVLKRWAKD